ncbi:LysR family transcriptional regulator [Paraburkholderia aspalathi]|uniref:Transcriptional regulator, LysR family n=1 Tax=Paraburkholderia aspalathi TaxID=1324617 RepID=A0A1I7ACU8_9BURK|nr:LysR family transcriptional regulator [Paraburkholderia aspalathi]SFT72670.1 transcriptional regulator, LysR family [Paraburkholderia aspalathi]
MLAKTQFKLAPSDLEVVLTLTRAGTMVEAGKRLGVDSSTVFRTIRRLEKGLGQRLFERSRAGSLPTELALNLVQGAEQIEAVLESIHTVVLPRQDGLITGTVRVTTTDTILHGLILPALKGLATSQPLLQIKLNASNEKVSLSKRDTDIAVRATKQPPDHLVGKRLGRIRVALFGSEGSYIPKLSMANLSSYAWIAPDEALPEHPSVLWRKRHYPKLEPRYEVNSIVSVAEAIAAGLGVGLIPLFLAEGRSDLIQLSDPLDECETQLWLLRHPESGHIRRISTVYSYLAEQLALA